MKLRHFAVVLILGWIVACAGQTPAPAENPFFSEYGTTFNVHPFDRIELEHFVPAFEEGMRRQNDEVAAIVTNPQEPDFENTIVALDRSGELLDEVSKVFFALAGSNTSDELQAINSEMAPRLAAHRDEIQSNPELFARIKAVYDARDVLGLSEAERYVLENIYLRAVRSGALLEGEQLARFKEISQELSRLKVEFGKNVLAETNAFELVIEDEKDLAGLPDGVIATARESAEKAGHEGKWLFTTHKPSMLPFLTYAENRELRQRLYEAYITRGDHDDEYDNKEILRSVVNLRLEQAQLLGYESYADFKLESRMAKTPEKVYELLDRLWAAALPVAEQEVAEMQAIIDAEGGDFALAPWDWWYYAEKLRLEKYQLDDNELRPYFQLDRVRDGVFRVAHELYGLDFSELEDMPKPHPEAQVFEVTDADGSHRAVIYMDFHPRPSKRGGAWCGGFRGQYHRGEEKVDPVINLVCNFTKPTADVPALLSLDEVQTLFHEFGHGLDGMLADVGFKTLFRSADFSELPSQIMEHWAMEPAVMKQYAVHYQTGEPIPDELIEKITRSTHFNQGFITVEYLAASLLDMKYHTITEPLTGDINEFEAAYFEEIGLIPEIISRYRSTYFSHIMGGYATGYYGYIWSGVLDNDAFAAFEETSLFDQETARRFRESVLERNGTADYMQMYVDFRGREPEIEPLLRNRGLS